MAKPQAITSLPRSPDDDRHERMLKYSIAMGVRIVCIFVCFITPGWWILIPVAGAVILPYVAVVLANVGSKSGGDVIDPGLAALPAHPGAPEADQGDQR